MAYPPGTKSRTIRWDDRIANPVRAACLYLGINQTQFITDAINDKLRRTFSQMAEDVPE